VDEYEILGGTAANYTYTSMTFIQRWIFSLIAIFQTTMTKKRVNTNSWNGFAPDGKWRIEIWAIRRGSWWESGGELLCWGLSVVECSLEGSD